jgi:diguanylate cyclase (GGDEF)-like protein
MPVPPGSVVRRVVLVAFVTTHLPLIAIVIVVAAGWARGWGVVLAALLATVVGCVGLLLALRHELRPVQQAARRLHGYLEGGPFRPAAEPHRPDEIGRLVSEIDAVCGRFEADRVALEQIANEDLLTGVLTRRAATHRLAHFHTEAVAGAPDRALALVDLDDLKVYNDRFGHHTGDEVLAHVAMLLSTTLRHVATVGRWGGDEFLVIAEDHVEGLRAGLERVRARLADEPLITAAGPLTVTVSVGVARLGPNDSIDAWVQRADAALYQAKASGKNAVEVR